MILGDISLLASLDVGNAEANVQWLLLCPSCAVLLFDCPTNLLGPLAIECSGLPVIVQSSSENRGTIIYDLLEGHWCVSRVQPVSARVRIKYITWWASSSL